LKALALEIKPLLKVKAIVKTEVNTMKQDLKVKRYFVILEKT
jgi:hypothetical protein